MTEAKSPRELKRGKRSKPVRAKKTKPEVQVMLESALKVYEAKSRGMKMKPEVYCGGERHVQG